MWHAEKRSFHMCGRLAVQVWCFGVQIAQQVVTQLRNGRAAASVVLWSNFDPGSIILIHGRDYYYYIIIIIIIITSFMQGIYTYIPETNYAPREHSVAAILLLQFMVLISLVSVLNVLYFCISTFGSMCAMPLWLFSVVPYYYYYYYHHHHHYHYHLLCAGYFYLHSWYKLCP